MAGAAEQPTFLDRTVYRSDANSGRVEISALDLWSHSLPIVLIGDPGMGKSYLTEALVLKNGAAKRVKAGAFVRNAKRYALKTDETCLVIDGLDEVAARTEGDPLQNVLTKLAEIGHPPFVLSCRAADWRSAGDSVAIAEDYGALPTVWTLAPLTDTEARRFCALEGLDENAAERLLRHVADRGLSELAQNPLTLKLLIEVASVTGEDLPDTRRDLYETAVRLICREGDEARLGSALNEIDVQTALDAAGAIGAALILSGCEEISREGLAIPEPGTLELPSLSELVAPDLAKLVLTSRLFKVEDAVRGRFAPIHRTIAEYLGARWLSRRLSGHRFARRRVLSLLSRDGVVPASFRGLHAWLSLDSNFAADVIDADPYGVLVYGDGDSLSATEGRLLLQALSKLEADDPFFRGDAWALRSTGCLVLPELKEDLRTYLRSPSVQFQFRSLILEALNGSALSRELVEDLEAIALNSDYSYRERVEAADGLVEAVPDEWDKTAFLQALHKLWDESSTRLALNCLDEFGLGHFAPELIANCILAHSGYLLGRPSNGEQRTGGMLYSMRREMPIQLCAPILDRMSEAVEEYSEEHRASDAGWDGWYEIRTFTQTTIRRVLESGFGDADRIARWVVRFEPSDYTDDEDRDLVASHFVANQELRQRVQHSLLFGTEADPDGIPMYRLRRYSAGLWPTPEDVAVHLKTLNAKSKFSGEDRHTWRGLVNAARTEEGIPPTVLGLAEIGASRDAELHRFLHPDPDAEPPPWKRNEEEAERRFAERQAERDRKELERLADYRDHIEGIRAGTSGALVTSAEMYHGRYTNVDRKLAQTARLAQWMHGDASLIDAALEGFDRVIERKDLPSAAQVSDSYAEGKVWNLCHPLLAGLNERLAAGSSMQDVDTGVLQSAWCALHVDLLNREGELADLASALRSRLQDTPGAWEQTLRTWFEPQFRVRKDHATALYEFAHKEADTDLVFKLCADWLAAFPDLNVESETELMFGLIRASGARRSEAYALLAEQAETRLANAKELDDRRRLLWRSIAFMTAFDRAEFWQQEAANQDFIWEVRRRIGYGNEVESENMALHIEQAAWLISAFRRAWPVAKPETYKRGDETSFDASQFLSRLIHDLAADTSDEAASALMALVGEDEDGYTNQLKAARASQQRRRVDAEFEPVSVATLANSVDNRPPEQHSDLQAYALSAIEALQDKLRGDDVDIIDLFYETKSENLPKVENDCRNALFGLLHLEHGIEASPEVAMPRATRADGGFRLNAMTIPLEAKGQWHSEVWTAAESQLDENYTIDHQAAGYGIYLVFWFGEDVPERRRLNRPPRGERLPASAAEMKEQLEARIASGRRDGIKVVVLDLERKVRKK